MSLPGELDLAAVAMPQLLGQLEHNLTALLISESALRRASFVRKVGDPPVISVEQVAADEKSVTFRTTYCPGRLVLR